MGEVNNGGIRIQSVESLHTELYNRVEFLSWSLFSAMQLKRQERKHGLPRLFRLIKSIFALITQWNANVSTASLHAILRETPDRRTEPGRRNGREEMQSLRYRLFLKFQNNVKKQNHCIYQRRNLISKVFCPMKHASHIKVLGWCSEE
jgi:hypothetical protein